MREVYAVLVHDSNSSDPAFIDGVFFTRERAQAHIDSGEVVERVLGGPPPNPDWTNVMNAVGLAVRRGVIAHRAIPGASWGKRFRYSLKEGT
jgi:hypothetical protein